MSFNPQFFIKCIFALILPLSSGYIFIAFLNALTGKTKLALPLLISLSFGVGIGILTQTMLVLNLISIDFSFKTISLAITMLSLLFLMLKLFLFKSNKTGFIETDPVPQERDKYTLSSKLLFLLFASYVLYSIYSVFSQAMTIPVSTYDAIHFIAFKSKMFFFEKNIWLIKNIEHASYPLLTELSQTWIALVLNKWHDQAIKIISPLAFISFLGIYWDFLKHYSTRIQAILGMLLLLSSNFLMLHATISYRDVLTMYYTCSFLMFIIRWYTSDDEIFLILASFLAGFGTFTKLEGTVYFVLGMVVLSVMILQKRLNSFFENILIMLKFIIPAGTICLAFYLVKYYLGIPPEKIALNITGYENLSRIPRILKAFSYDLFFTGNWNICWLLFFAGIAFNIGKILYDPAVSYLILSLGLFFSFYFMNGLFTENFELLGGPGTFTTLSRLILQFFPLATAATALLLAPGTEKN